MVSATFMVDDTWKQMLIIVVFSSFRWERQIQTYILAFSTTISYTFILRLPNTVRGGCPSSIRQIVPGAKEPTRVDSSLGNG